MVQVLSLPGQIRGGIHAGKSVEIMDKMRLIEIAAVSREVHPIKISAFMNQLQYPLETADAAEQLGREPHLMAEELDKTA